MPWREKSRTRHGDGEYRGQIAILNVVVRMVALGKIMYEHRCEGGWD